MRVFLVLIMLIYTGLCPTPYFLFGVRKGSEKNIARLRRFLFFYSSVVILHFYGIKISFKFKRT